jgi:hypothetical protein
MGRAMPCRNTTTGTLPIRVVLEKDLFGGVERGAVGTGFGAKFDMDPGTAEGLLTGSSPATISCRSCVHCPSLASGLECLACGTIVSYQEHMTKGSGKAHLRTFPSTMSP